MDFGRGHERSPAVAGRVSVEWMEEQSYQEIAEEIAGDTTLMMLPNPLKYREEFIEKAKAGGHEKLLQLYRNGLPKGTKKSDSREYFCTVCRGIASVMGDSDISLINTIFKGAKCCPEHWDSQDYNDLGTFGYNVIIEALFTESIPYSDENLNENRLKVLKLTDVTEKEAEWFINGYVPKGQATTLAGDGGSGKTSLWCSIAASVSNGYSPFFASGETDRKPQKVLFFSAEDSVQHTLKKKLRQCGANMENIITVDIADEHFKDIKFNSPLLESLVEEHRPELLIFDPIQAFIPPEMNMGYRNAMRQCLAPLIAMGEKYGVTTIVVVHANKRAGAYGRNRIADSADIWDISRSVLMTGETNEKGIRYMTQEKNNYGPLQNTVLFSIEDGVPVFKGFTDKRDRDFVQDSNYTEKVAPAKDEARAFILDYLRDGEKEVKDLDGMGKAQGHSPNALKNAKAELKKEKLVAYRTKSLGHKKGVIQLIHLEGEALKYFRPPKEV